MPASSFPPSATSLPVQYFLQLEDTTSSTSPGATKPSQTEEQPPRFPYLSGSPPLPFLLSELISSAVTDLWKPRAEVLQMICHHAKHGRKRAPRQLSDATWETGEEAAAAAAAAAACVTAAFISPFNHGCKLLGASTFRWPSFGVGRGERAGGEELARKRERKGKHGMPGGGRTPTFG